MSLEKLIKGIVMATVEDLSPNTKWRHTESDVEVCISHIHEGHVYFLYSAVGLMHLPIDEFLSKHTAITMLVEDIAKQIVEELDYDMYKEMFVVNPEDGADFVKFIRKFFE